MDLGLGVQDYLGLGVGVVRLTTNHVREQQVRPVRTLRMEP